MKRSAVAVLVALAVALLVGGCGGGSEAGSTSTAPEGGATEGGATEGGAPSKATAPDAPAGSKVVACAENRMEMEGLRATEVDCATARDTMRHWVSSHACNLGEGSRSSCSLGGFRCQAVKVGKGAAVSCAGPRGDVAWIAKAWPAKKAG